MAIFQPVNNLMGLKATAVALVIYIAVKYDAVEDLVLIAGAGDDSHQERFAQCRFAQLLHRHPVGLAIEIAEIVDYLLPVDELAVGPHHVAEVVFRRPGRLALKVYRQPQQGGEGKNQSCSHRSGSLSMCAGMDVSGRGEVYTCAGAVVKEAVLQEG